MQAIGQLMLDVSGYQLTAQEVQRLASPVVGGVILFARNVQTPTQVRALTDSIRAINPNILIAVDQEGGRVARLREGFSPLPAMGKLGVLFDQDPIAALDTAWACGYQLAVEVLAVGIDFSFAPVLDVNGVSQVIGDRGFHAHPTAVTTLAASLMQGMHAAGMATTGKHFPGHGSVAPDSHHEQAVDERPLAQILAYDMQPFIRNLSLLDALMPAHVIFSQVDAQPAGFSRYWLQQIIRNQLGFDGVLFSDDLSMKAAHVAGDVTARLHAALSAGCDMGLVCNDEPAAAQALTYLTEHPELISQASQHRLARMRGNLKPWQGTLTATAEQWQDWAVQQARVHKQFFA